MKALRTHGKACDAFLLGVVLQVISDVSVVRMHCNRSLGFFWRVFRGQHLPSPFRREVSCGLHTALLLSSGCFLCLASFMYAYLRRLTGMYICIHTRLLFFLSVSFAGICFFRIYWAGSP